MESNYGRATEIASSNAGSSLPIADISQPDSSADRNEQPPQVPESEPLLSANVNDSSEVFPTATLQNSSEEEHQHQQDEANESQHNIVPSNPNTHLNNSRGMFDSETSWRPHFVMIIYFLIGFFATVGHHLFYNHLQGTIVGDKTLQNVYIRFLLSPEAWVS
jgi:hypothetical protein